MTFPHTINISTTRPVFMGEMQQQDLWITRLVENLLFIERIETLVGGAGL